MTNGSMTFGLVSSDKKEQTYIIEEERSTAYKEVPPYTMKAKNIDDLRRKLCKDYKDRKYFVSRKYTVFVEDSSAWKRKMLGRLTYGSAYNDNVIWTISYSNFRLVDPATGKLKRRE